jgi:Zn-dependent protease
MDNFPIPSDEWSPEPPAATAEPTVYPPKFEKREAAANVWLRSLLSLALYLVLGYYIFPSYKILLLITAIVIIHEMGHFRAMKYFRYNDLGIFFIPLLGAYVSGTKREVSQRQSAIILLAGPLPGILIGTIFYLLDRNNHGQYLFDISYTQIGWFFIILNLINLFPVYPLDGGQLLNRVFLDEESVWSKVFVFVSAGFLCWIAWKSNFPVLYIFPALLLLRLVGEKRYTNIEKRIEAENIHADVDYADLPDRDYWRIRNILIAEHPSFKDIPPSPPFEYHPREEKIMTTVQSLLHRHLIQDVSVAGKIFIFLLWIAAIVSPWLLNLDMSFFRRFGL